jgi:hypothetical protein
MLYNCLSRSNSAIQWRDRHLSTVSLEYFAIRHIDGPLPLEFAILELLESLNYFSPLGGEGDNA